MLDTLHNYFNSNNDFCEVSDLMSTSLLITLALAATTLAAPHYYSAVVRHCDISNAELSLPPNRTAFSAPTSPLSHLVLGVGVQNYTCSSTGTYT